MRRATDSAWEIHQEYIWSHVSAVGPAEMQWSRDVASPSGHSKVAAMALAHTVASAVMLQETQFERHEAFTGTIRTGRASLALSCKAPARSTAPGSSSVLSTSLRAGTALGLSWFSAAS